MPDPLWGDGGRAPGPKWSFPLLPTAPFSQRGFIYPCNQMQVWLPAASKAKCFWEAGADVKESGFIQVQASWKMRDLCVKGRLSIPGVLDSLYRGIVGIGELRNLWQRAAPGGFNVISCACHPAASSLHLQLPCWYLGTGCAGSALLVLTWIADACPVSCGQGHSLLKQELQLLNIPKILTSKLLICESSMSLLVQPIL